MGLLLGSPGGAAAEEAVILTDIQGSEDALGDMDFKVAGDRDGITAFQMDIKVEGITLPVMARALAAARSARRRLLDAMARLLLRFFFLLLTPQRRLLDAIARPRVPLLPLLFFCKPAPLLLSLAAPRLAETGWTEEARWLMTCLCRRHALRRRAASCRRMRPPSSRSRLTPK